MKRFILSLAAALALGVSPWAQAAPFCPSPAEILARRADFAPFFEESAEEAVSRTGLKGEKAKLFKKLASRYLRTAFGNELFLDQLHSACLNGTKDVFIRGWMMQHASRNLWRLSFEDQQTMQGFLLAMTSIMPDPKTCAGYHHRPGSVPDSMLSALTQKAYRLMSADQLEALFGMIRRAAALEDTDEKPEDFDQETIREAYADLLGLAKQAIARDFPPEEGKAIWEALETGDKRSDETRCLADLEFQLAIQELKGTSARVIMQTLSNGISEAAMEKGYAGLPESGK